MKAAYGPWAVLIPVFGLATVVAFQQSVIHRLRTEARQAAEEPSQASEHVVETPPPLQSDRLEREELERLRRENRDILRLRNEVHGLREQIRERERAAEELRNAQGGLRAQNGVLGATASDVEPIPPILRNSFIGAVFVGSFTNSQPQGVVLESVVADSAAAEAQLQGGDVILRVDGRPMTSVEQVVRIVASHSPGDKLVFDFLRDGLPKQVAVVTKPPPVGWTRP
jgi:C-terminal processing protease CtpA/Prc